MKHFDLFSGYGGFSLALENVYGLCNSKCEYIGLKSQQEKCSQGRVGAVGTKYGLNEINKITKNVYPPDLKFEISDSQRYKLCGNGVCIPVVEHLLRELILSDTL